MKKSQVQRILDTLNDGAWHCTSEFYADFMADPRRRMKDIQEKGFDLESRICKSHTYHDGQSKEWRLVKIVQKPKLVHTYVLINGQRVAVSEL